MSKKAQATEEHYDPAKSRLAAHQLDEFLKIQDLSDLLHSK